MIKCKGCGTDRNTGSYCPNCGSMHFEQNNDPKLDVYVTDDPRILDWLKKTTPYVLEAKKKESKQ